MIILLRENDSSPFRRNENLFECMAFKEVFIYLIFATAKIFLSFSRSEIIIRRSRSSFRPKGELSFARSAIYPFYISRQIKQSRQYCIKQIGKHSRHSVGNVAEDCGQEKGIAFEEHIIRADGGEIDDIRGDRNYQHRQSGEDEFPRLFNAVISMISRNEHHQH